MIEERQIKAPLTLEEAQVSVTLAAAAGGMLEIGDDLPRREIEVGRLRHAGAIRIDGQQAAGGTGNLGDVEHHRGGIGGNGISTDR